MAVKNVTRNRSSLTVMSWNARSIKGKTSTKMNELQNFLNNSKENYDIICIQETWYKKNDKPFSLKGYQSPINRIRTENCGRSMYICQT